MEQDSITISLDNSKGANLVSKRLDCGIAMLHLEVGAGFAGVEGRWQYLNSPDVAQFKIF